MKIAIIGMGVAGISLIRECQKQMSQTQLKKVEIIVFADKDLFGTGLPYQVDDPSLLLNQYAESMTIDPTQPSDFLKWVELNKNLSTVKHEHVPRFWFGEYLKERLEEWLVGLPVRMRYQKVHRIRATSRDTYRVETNDHVEEVDYIHLATGHLAYQDPFQLKRHKNYIQNPYPVYKELKLEKKAATIGILGSRLTAIDVMRYLKKNHPYAVFHFFSLDAKFSSVRGHFPHTIIPADKKAEYLKALLDTKELTLKKVEEWFLQIGEDYQIDIKWIWKNLGRGDLLSLKKDLNHLEELGRFQKLIGELKDTFPYIWSALSEREKAHFKEDRELHFLNYKIPIPQKIAKEILVLAEEDRLFMHTSISSIKKRETDFAVECRNEDLISVDYIVNATGQRTQLGSQLDNQQPLVKQLIQDKLIAPYPFGGINIEYPSMSVIDHTGKVNSRFKVYGQLVSGIQYGNTNVDLVSHSAITGIQSMLQSIGI